MDIDTKVNGKMICTKGMELKLGVMEKNMWVNFYQGREEVMANISGLMEALTMASGWIIAKMAMGCSYGKMAVSIMDSILTVNGKAWV